MKQPPQNTAAARWAAELAAWAIDPQILAAAPESPYRLPPSQFRPADRGAYDTGPDLARERALQVLPAGGTVLDVGCGAGAAGLALAPPAGLVTGVDEQADMLEAFRTEAAGRGVAAATVTGRWPEVAGQVEPADVVVSNHVLYNVAELAPFVLALDAHARRRVVIEVTERHPWARVGPLWQRAHHQPRPDGPSAELAGQVIAEAGIDVHLEHARRSGHPQDWVEMVSTMRRRLCLPESADPTVDGWMRELGMDQESPEREVAVLWWEPTH